MVELQDLQGEFITVEELAEEVEFLQWVKGCCRFDIQECFIKNPNHCYCLEGFHVEIEGDTVCCYDNDGKIYKECCALMSFLKATLLSISQTIMAGVTHEYLKFKDGYIKIAIS